MKNKIFLLFIIVLSINCLVGCSSRKISDEVYDECKRAVNVTEDYLNFDISLDDAKERFNRIDCNEKNIDDAVVCSNISLLNIQLSSARCKKNDSEIKDTLKELKDECDL